MSILAIISFLDPIVKFFINKFIKNEADKAAKHAAWEAKKNNLINGATVSGNMKTGYDQAVKDQDARLNNK